MLIRKPPPRALALDEPIRHVTGHGRPVTRRDFIGRGLAAGAATVIAPSVFGLFANPRQAHAALSPDLELLRQRCGIAVQGAGKIPFICIDLAGGANMAGSNVLVGQQGGQLDSLSTAGYGRLGLPGDMVPMAPNTASATGNFTNVDLDLCAASSIGSRPRRRQASAAP
jgi:hypothetical protein